MNIKKYILDGSYRASQGIAAAVLVCLGIGLLLQTVGALLDVAWLQKIGFVAKNLFVPALGLSIAMVFRANSMIVICATIAALLGGGGVIVSSEGLFTIKGGEPIGAIIACLVTIWVGKKIVGKTNFDMILTPMICLVVGGIIGFLSVEILTPILSTIAKGVNTMFVYSPIVSSIFISILFAILILSPASSAALSIAFALDPIASAAALIGCSVQFTAFAFLGMKDNSWGAFWGQLICTPKLQTPNIIQTPRIVIVPLILSALMAPLGVLAFGIVSVNEVAGLGLCAFVAPLYMLSNQGVTMFLYFILVSVVIPAILSITIRPIAEKYGLLKSGELEVKL